VPLPCFSKFLYSGTLITALSLAFDPFMQQVVVYTVRPVSKGEAAIGRAQTIIKTILVPVTITVSIYQWERRFIMGHSMEMQHHSSHPFVPQGIAPGSLCHL